MTIQEFNDKCKNLRMSSAMKRGQLKEKEELKSRTEKSIDNLKKKDEELKKCAIMLNNASNISRGSIKAHFEKIVTDALQFATQSNDYEFVIQEFVNRKKVSYEFFVKSSVNGIECLQKPEDANGGGFVDIISVAMKYAYYQLFNEPRIMSSTLFYDEPGKMISADMSVKFAEYVKFLGNNYNKQTIMITHNDRMASIADKNFTVVKNSKGISAVTENKSEDFKHYESLIDKLFKGSEVTS